VPLAEVARYLRVSTSCSTNETGESESNVEVTPACGGVGVDRVVILPVPRGLGGWLSFQRNDRGAVWRQFPRPDATVEVLVVPLKVSRYSFIHGHSFTDSHRILAKAFEERLSLFNKLVKNHQIEYSQRMVQISSGQEKKEIALKEMRTSGKDLRPEESA